MIFLNQSQFSQRYGEATTLLLFCYVTTNNGYFLHCWIIFMLQNVFGWSFRFFLSYCVKGIRSESDYFNNFIV